MAPRLLLIIGLLVSTMLNAQFFYKTIPLITSSHNGIIDNTTNALQLKNGEYQVGRHSFRPVHVHIPGAPVIFVDMFTNGLLKYDRFGSQIFSNSLEVVPLAYCNPHDVTDDRYSSRSIQLSNGSLLTAANFSNYDTDQSGPAYRMGFSLVKSDPTTGLVIDTKVIDGGCYNMNRSTVVNDIKEDSKNNIYLTGYSQGGGIPTKCFVIKLNWTSGIRWSTVYQLDDGDTQGISLLLNEKNNTMYVGGNVINSNGDRDVFLTSIELSKGTVQWTQQYGGIKDDILSKLQSSLEQEIIFFGSSNSFGGGNNHYDYWLTRTDLNGQVIWSNTYGGDNYEAGIDMTSSMINKQYVLGGKTADGKYGGNDIQLFWVNGNGDIKDGRQYGTSDHDYLFSLTSTSDNGLLIWGCSGLSTGLLYKTNFGGIIPKTFCTSEKYIPPQHAVAPLTKTPNLSLFDLRFTDRLATTERKPENVSDYLHCLNSTSTSQAAIQNILKETDDKQELVTVAQAGGNAITLRFTKNYQQGYYSLCTLSGQLLQHTKLSGRETETISLANLTPGIYLLKLTVDNKTTVQKIFKN